MKTKWEKAEEKAHKRKLVFLEILIQTANELQRLEGDHRYLLLHESVSNLYMWCKKHGHMNEYYDYENPNNTEREFREMLNSPLGELLLGDRFKTIDQDATELKRLQREEERKLNPPFDPSSLRKS